MVLLKQKRYLTKEGGVPFIEHALYRFPMVHITSKISSRLLSKQIFFQSQRVTLHVDRNSKPRISEKGESDYIKNYIF